jgi:hypothetical protein
MSPAQLVGALLGDAKESSDIDDPKDALCQDLLATEPVAVGVVIGVDRNVASRQLEVARVSTLPRSSCASWTRSSNGTARHG